MMFQTNIRLAVESIKKAKLRNFMTMLGIIIGTASVITIVSIGEGVRQQVQEQVKELGTNLIIVRPARLNASDDTITQNVQSISPGAFTPLTEDDLKAIGKTPGVSAFAPLIAVNGVPSYEEKDFRQGLVIGTTSDFADVIRQEVEFGNFLTDTDEGRQFAVVGRNVAQQLFGQNVPIGRSFDFKGQEIVVKGVFSEFVNDPFATGLDLNNVIFIPYTSAKELNSGNAAIFQIFVEPANDKDRDQVAANVEKSLLKTHADQRDFQVLDQDDTVVLSNNLLNVLTALVAAIAGISLFVGGIGIMNVMLVSVTERTREIGVRKAVGATNKQIMSQFLIEATMLSVVGSILGVVTAGLTNIILRIVTDLQPVITWQIVLIAIGVSWVTGVIFGVAPAIKASRKDPIDALRYE